jgi:hypothetical protein
VQRISSTITAQNEKKINTGNPPCGVVNVTCTEVEELDPQVHIVDGETEIEMG